MTDSPPIETHYLDFQTNDKEILRWKGTEDQYNYLMNEIASYAQIIDLRTTLGKTFSFKQFTGESGKLKRSGIALPSPADTPSRFDTDPPDQETWLKILEAVVEKYNPPTKLILHGFAMSFWNNKKEDELLNPEKDGNQKTNEK